MKLRLLLCIFLITTVLSACQAPAGQPAQANTAGQPASVDYIFHPPADPAAATVTLDDAHAAEALITTAGGTLRASGADGAQYELEIPGDALLNDTTIRLIPAAVSGLPFGGEVTYAAQLEPEGLFFNNFATLTITPSQEIPLKEQLFFGYQGAGQDVIYAPPVVDSQEIKIRLLHFSGYGVTKGLLADPESVRERLGGSAERRLQSRMAELLAAERQRQLLGAGEGDATTLAGELSLMLAEYQKEVVDVRVAAAGESCAAGRLAMQTVLGLERQKQLLGLGEGGMNPFGSLMDTVARVCIKEEYELCAEDHIIHRMIPVWLGIERQMQLLGVENSPVSDYAKEMAQKCLTFELDFESQGTFDDGGGGGFDSSVKAKIPLHLLPEAFVISGQTALVNDSFTFKVPDCKVTSNRGGSSISVDALVIIADHHSPSDELGYVSDFRLTYFPEKTTENFTVACEDSPPYTSPAMGLWWGEYLVLHAGELSASGGDPSAPPAAPAMPDLGAMMSAAQSGFSLPAIPIPAVSGGAGFVLQDWEIMGGEYFAKKEWIKEDADLGLVEAGTFKLYHRPGQ